MPLPLAGAAMWLLRRYGLKKMSDETKNVMRERVQDTAKAKGKVLTESGEKWAMRRKRAGNVALDLFGDASLAMSTKVIYDFLKNKPNNEAKEALKEKSPRLYKQYLDSDELNVAKWLEARNQND